ncbi:phospholipase A2-like [Pomacea canaliculata]|uniref:phospholipase A2-like n=1 Tax=Pomacea canaliculata TaxID=400727 RepID=UPI000D73F6A8|nr:phospholipase A2-like [Pomacea canaliculata]
MYPGTLWCGDGDNANGDTTKLGEYRQTDSCCRAHDLCTPYIAKFTNDPETGLYNPGLYTRLHCRCDNEFRDCLRRSRDHLADTIGNLYFNVFTSICFDQVSRCPDNGFSPDCTSWEWVSLKDF